MHVYVLYVSYFLDTPCTKARSTFPAFRMLTFFAIAKQLKLTFFMRHPASTDMHYNILIFNVRILLVIGTWRNRLDPTKVFGDRREINLKCLPACRYVVAVQEFCNCKTMPINSASRFRSDAKLAGTDIDSDNDMCSPRRRCAFFNVGSFAVVHHHDALTIRYWHCLWTYTILSGRKLSIIHLHSSYCDLGVRTKQKRFLSLPSPQSLQSKAQSETH